MESQASSSTFPTPYIHPSAIHEWFLLILVKSTMHATDAGTTGRPGDQVAAVVGVHY